MPLTTSPSPSAALPGRPADRAQVLADLESEDSARRRQAARALAGNLDAVDALCARLAREDDVAVWDAILTALLRIGGGEAVQGLLGYLRAEPALLRNEVLEALKAFPQGEIAAHLRARLADPDPHLRIAAVQLVAALRDDSGVRLLCEVLDGDPHVNVVAAAVDLLAEMGTPAAVPALERAQARFAEVPFMSFAIDTAIARIGP